jgi:putative hydrolase of the HAD superfamily
MIMERPAALVVDHAVAAELLGLVDDVRAAGLPVALAVTGDGTDRGTSDLAGRFDVVVDAGAKPARAFFAAACTAVSAPPARTLVVDDVDRNVRGARAAGLKALRYGGEGDLRYLRAALGL